MSLVLAHLSETTWAHVETLSSATGVEEAIDTIRRFMVATSTYEPLREFVVREPVLALRILHGPESPVTRVVRAGMGRAIATHAPAVASRLPPELLTAISHTCTALVWTPVIIGQEPDIERALAMSASTLRSLDQLDD